MITRFRVQNYKALRDVTLDLTPIHVLIGPNDSGKTSILEAMAALCRSVDHELTEAFTGSWEGRDLVWRGEPDSRVSLMVTVEHDQEGFDYDLGCGFADMGVRHVVPGGETFKFESEPEPVLVRKCPRLSKPEKNESAVRHNLDGRTSDRQVREQLVHNALAGAQFYRWDPRLLALPVAPDTKRRFRMESSGFGLALCLDDILGYDRNLFARLEARFTQLFPHIKSIRLTPKPAYKAPIDDPERIPLLDRADGKGIDFVFSDGDQAFPASQASDGMLLVLAYLAVLHLPKPPRVLLVEEPENGVHPKRLQEVLTILRNLVQEQSRTQIILTTHSPYVVDLFAPEEVTLCHMEDDGAVSVHRLSDSQKIREQLDVFTLGEIWTAEGDESLAQPSPPDKEPDR